MSILPPSYVTDRLDRGGPSDVAEWLCRMIAQVRRDLEEVEEIRSAKAVRWKRKREFVEFSIPRASDVGLDIVFVYTPIEEASGSSFRQEVEHSRITGKMTINVPFVVEPHPERVGYFRARLPLSKI